MTFKAWSLALLCLAAPLAAAEPAPIEAATPAPAVTPALNAAWAEKVKLSGFLKAWYTAIESKPENDYEAGSAYIKNLRLKVEAKPAPDYSVVVMPEIAGNAFTLLDAYIAVKRGPLTLTGGQFSVPFSQDYTTSPAKLWSVDNSAVTASLYPYKNRDQGVMATLALGPVKLQAAAVQGLGINITPSASGYVNDVKDVNNAVGRLELAVHSGAVLGFAWYNGRQAGTAGAYSFNNWQAQTQHSWEFVHSLGFSL